MRFHSTNHKSPEVDLEQAVMAGLAPDGGLYMPDVFPTLSPELLKKLPSLTFTQVAHEISSLFFKDDLPHEVLTKIVDESFDFPVPLVAIENNIHVLELFHGPTLAFKDFAARFMARLMSHYQKKSDKELTILVATSGDTGSAVASGFYNVPGIRVIILYPSKKVSALQEAQLTTMGGNISALEVQGSFDECQALVKKAFVDSELSSVLKLGSANSINIARLLPQSFYFFYAATRFSEPIIFSVPSGNFGNLTAGLIAHRMGLPVERFIASTNANSVFTEYLDSGVYTPRPSVSTLSNAMDVGSPSNFARISELYNNNRENMSADISSYSFSDMETSEAMQEVKKKSGYILDPHGAVGYLGLKKYISQNSSAAPGIFLETAHPAKFIEGVEIPERLASCMKKTKKAVLLAADFCELKKYLLSKN